MQLDTVVAKSFWYDSIPVAPTLHIRLPDKHNVANHFCLQAFLSEQSFPSLSMSCCSSSTDCYFVVFQDQLAASSNFIPAADIV